jgi:hypothetical protein
MPKFLLKLMEEYDAVGNNFRPGWSTAVADFVVAWSYRGCSGACFRICSLPADDDTERRK